MKKITVVLVFVLMCVSVFAQKKRLFGGMLVIEKAEELQTKTGKIPEGKEFFPVFYSKDFGLKINRNGYSGAEKENMKFIKKDVISNTYELLCKGNAPDLRDPVEVTVTITIEGNRFSVVSVDGTRKSGDTHNTENDISEAFVKGIEEIFSSSSFDTEYVKLYETAYTDMDVQFSIPSYAPNKLKAKQWYNKYSLVGKEIEIPFYFRAIDEANDDTYSLELSGTYGTVAAKNVKVKVLSNNDEYIDTKDNQLLTIKGKVRSIEYDDTDYSIKSIIIEER